MELHEYLSDRYFIANKPPAQLGTRRHQNVAKGMWSAYFCPLSTLKTRRAVLHKTQPYFTYTVTCRPYLSPSLHLAHFSDFVWEERCPIPIEPHQHPWPVDIPISYLCRYRYMKAYAKVCMKVYMNVQTHISHTGSKKLQQLTQINVQTQLFHNCYNS